MAARNIFLVLHVTALLLAFLPFLAEGTDRFVSLAVYSAMLYPLALLLERGLYPLVSLLLVSTACPPPLRGYARGACGTVRWGGAEGRPVPLQHFFTSCRTCPCQSENWR